MLLIHPPVAKPSEPPAGMARLSAALSRKEVKHWVLDANIESLLYILKRAEPVRSGPMDRWTARAFRTASKNYELLKKQSIYQHTDRYKRAVSDLNRAVEMSANRGTSLSLVNFRQEGFSPLNSADLVRASENPEFSPYYPYFEDRLLKLVENRRPAFVGFSLNYLSQAVSTFAMIGLLRKHFPEIIIILGGGLVTSWLSNPNWKNPFSGLVDHFIPGPGEAQLLGLLGQGNGEESFCTPDYDILPRNDYLAPGFILPYSASSGCYWNTCSFCPEPAENNPYIPASVDKVMDDLSSLTARSKPVLIHLLDNAVSTGLLKKLSENPPGVPWYGFVRIDHHLADIDFCKALRKSGCVMLKLGLESGDQGVLDRLHKGIDLTTASLALKNLKRAGIATYVYLIFGTPPETVHEARKTLDFVVAHREEIGFLNLAIFNMPVRGSGSLEFETDSFYDGDLSLYTNFVHPQGWNRKNVRLFLDNEFKKNRAVAIILQNDPPLFTSNHAPFFCDSG